MTTRSVVTGLLALTLLAVPALQAGSGSPPPLTDKKASKQLQKEINSHLKFQRQETNRIVKDFCFAIDEFEDYLKDDSFEAECLVENLINEMGFQLGMLHENSTTVLNTINFDAEQLLIQVEGIPDAFLEGACSSLDKAKDKVRDTLDKATDKMRAKMKSFAKKARKVQDLGVAAVFVPPEPVAIAPDPVAPPVPQVKDLKAEARMSASNGMLCISGTYSGDPGISVSAEITLNGKQYGQSATVDGCRWMVCFGREGSSEGPLPPGNYPIEVREFNVDGTQDTVTTTFGVPGS